MNNMTTLNPSIAVIIIIAVISLIIFIKTKNKSPKQKFDYIYRRTSLMSRWEQNFFRDITAVLPKHIACFTQVRYADFISPATQPDLANTTAANRRIFARSADFVLYNKNNGKVVLVYELNDKTHKRQDRIKRDNEIKNALSSAGIPLFVVLPGEKPDIRSQIAYSDTP